MDRSRKCLTCGALLADGDNHIKCMLCLGNHDMSLCPVCKSMNTPAKALRRRAYNDASKSGFIMLGAIRHIFPPLPQEGAAVPIQSHPGELLDQVDRHVGSYFHSLPDRTQDNMLRKDDEESHELAEESLLHEKSPEKPAIPKTRLQELRHMFRMSQEELDLAINDKDFRAAAESQLVANPTQWQDLAGTGPQHFFAGGALQLEEIEEIPPPVSPIKEVIPHARKRSAPGSRPGVQGRVPRRPTTRGGGPPKRTRLEQVEDQVTGMSQRMDAFMNRIQTFMAPGGQAPPPQPRQTAQGVPPVAVPIPKPHDPPRGAGVTIAPMLPLEPTLTPARPIPSGFTPGYHVPRVPSVSNLSRRSEEDYDDERSEMFSPEDLARTEIRQQWLTNVRDILVDVPDMEPTPEPSSIGTHVHSLAPKAQKLKMPLLQEVKEVLKAHTEKPAKNFNHLVRRYYPVHDVLEKGFMTPRDVPQSVITEVHPSNLFQVGASSSTARLKRTTISGVQEELALSQSQFASSALRLVNSNILSMSSMRQLLQGVIDQVDYVSESDQDPSRFDNIRSDLDLMNKAVNDMDGGNGDLLKLTSIQYNDAQRLRSNAWLESTRLPAQMKKELKVLPQQVSVEGSVPTPLFSSAVVDRIHQHVQGQKDNAWRFGAKPQQSARPRQRFKKPRGGFSGHPQQQGQQQFHQQSQQQGFNQPRGGGQHFGGRGRGNQSRQPRGGGRGRGGFSNNQASNQQK